MKIKSIFKRSLAVLLSLMMLLTSGIVSAVAANVELAPVGATVTSDGTARLYFNMSAVSWWTAGTNGNGNFAYFFNSSTNAWSAHSVNYSGNTYYVTIPSGSWTTVILTRNNTSTSPSWDNMWNQTGNITLSSTSNYISSFSEGSTSATWGTAVKPISTASLAANSTSVNTGTAVTLTPSLSSNSSLNTIKSTSYSISPSSGASISGNTFTATEAGTYTVTATVTYHPNGYSSLTSTATATTTITATTPGYSYTVEAGDGGTVAPSGNGTGTSVEITATPSTGYEFDGWTVTGGGSVDDASSATTTLTLTADGAVATANFKKLTYTVNFYDEDGATLLDTQTVAYGDTPTYGGDTPTKAGHTFADWTPALGAITGDTDYKATYTPNDYTVTVTANPTEGGTVTGGGDYEYGSTVTLTAESDIDASYVFAGWTLSGGYELTNGSTTSNETITIKVTDDVTAVANFTQITTYKVTTAVTPEGAGTATSRENIVIDGNSTVITATASEGYTFSGWTVVGDYNTINFNPDSTSTTINPLGDITVTANFTPNTGTVNFATSGNGTVSNAGANEVTYDNTVTSTATPNTGYHFLNWTVEGGTLDTDYKIISGGVDEDTIEIQILTQGANVVATANFEIDTYTVRFFDEGGAYLGDDKVTYGSAATAPDEPTKVGYTFAGWDKDFSNVTGDLLVYATYTANTYTVTVNNTVEGGTASASVNSVTYPNTVTLTVVPNADYIFTGWSIQGSYTVTTGSESESVVTIQPTSDIIATPSFAEGQYLTVYTYSGDGYNKLTLKESNGTTTNTVLNAVAQPDEFTYNGTTWDASAQQELTPGYSSSVTAQLEGTGGIPSGSGSLVVFNNTLGWSNVYLFTSSNNLWNGDNGCTTNGATCYTMTRVSGTNYWYAYVSSTASILFMKDKQTGYNNIYNTAASFRTDYNSSYPTFTPNTTSSQTTNGTTYYSNGAWSGKPTIKAESDAIELKDYLYNTDGSWAGNTEVWIYQNGTTEYVTLRRDLLDLITTTTTEYNGGVNEKDYTTESWNNFVTAYTAAQTAMADVDAQQTAIDNAETALQEAYDELELQAYFTVTVTQTGDSLGTVTIGTNSVATATGAVQVTQNKEVDVVVTAPAGYYIASVTGAVEAVNKVSPYSTSITVTADCEISVTYAKNPTVTVVADGGTITVEGATSPVSVTYGSTPSLSVKAPEGYFISSVMVGATVIETNTNESVYENEYTLPSVTADTTVVVTYGTRTLYTITVEPYDAAGGTLYDHTGTAIDPAGATLEVYAGDSRTFTATANDNYAVLNWVVNGTEKSGATSYTVSNVNSNVTLKLNWEELQNVDVTIKGSPNSVGTVTAVADGTTYTNKTTNSFTILEGTQITLTVSGIDGRYVFTGWNISGSYTTVEGNRNSETFVIKANEDLTVVANFTQAYRRIYLKNDAGWSTPYVYHFGSSVSDSYPGAKMTYDSTSGFWYRDVPVEVTGLKFNQGGDAGVQYDGVTSSQNLFTNASDTTGYPTTYVEAGYYLQGKWNGGSYIASNLVQFGDNGDGTYTLTLSVTSTTDGYIYVNPVNQDSHCWNAATNGATGNPQTLTATGAYQASPNYVKVEIDTANLSAAYDVTFTFNPTTGAFSWSKEVHVPTITIIGTDGQTKEPLSGIDDNMDTPNGRIGDTYFDYDTVKSVTSYTYYDEAQVETGAPVTFFTQVNMNAINSNAYDYRVEGWVINGTEFVTATNLGNGLYSGSYVFTEETNTVIPVYFHTKQWLENAGVKTVTVYAVADKDIENWDKYLAAYTWYKVSGVNKYEQFGKYSGQVMIPVAGLDGVYYTYVEYGTEDKIQISGITFNNYANGDDYDVVVNDYTNIQTYDYYEFIALLGDGKENITFVLKDTNDTYNSNRVSTSSINISGGNWDFVQFTDYSGLKTDIFGNNIEEIDSTLSDSNALYVVQAGDKAYTTGTLDGQWYVDCYLYNASGTYLGKCYSYELHDEDSSIWDTLAAYKNQRAYISYEKVNGNRYDGEWYGDANVSVTVNIAVNVALMNDSGSYDVNTTAPVNEAEYGDGYINVSYQNIDAARGATATLSAMPNSGYKFVGWYSADGKLFSENVSVSITVAIGTTYTAVFEPLEEGQFYVNHYIYKNDSEVMPSHGGNAVLYVGIDNTTEGTSTGLLKGNSANLAVTEGDELIITIATDATGADKFYSWYTNAVDKNGNKTYEEVGVDSADNLYDNKGTVVGRNDIVYFQFKYVFKDGDDFFINLYSDLMYTSVDVTLLYQYTDRFGDVKSYYVPYTLSAEEIEGFAGNDSTPYTPAYISGEGWTNTILANAPYVEDYYKDTQWTINSAMYDTLTFVLWATQPNTTYEVTIYNGADTIIKTGTYNQLITLDANELFGGNSGYGFWYEDIDMNGSYTDGDKIITYNAYFGYRITANMHIGYEKTSGGIDFGVSLDAPVYGREQTTDKDGNVTSDKVIVDYIVNIITPHLYGEEGYKDQPMYNGEPLEGTWTGAHVTVEDYERVENVTVEYGVVVQMFGTGVMVNDDETFNQALEIATGKGYGTSNKDDENLKTAADGTQVTDKENLIAYYNYTTTNQITNFNRVLLTISYNNTEKNRGYFYNVYAYAKVTDNETGESVYYFGDAQYQNIYEEGTKDAVIGGNTTFE